MVTVAESSLSARPFRRETGAVVIKGRRLICRDGCGTILRPEKDISSDIRIDSRYPRGSP